MRYLPSFLALLILLTACGKGGSFSEKLADSQIIDSPPSAKSSGVVGSGTGIYPAVTLLTPKVKNHKPGEKISYFVEWRNANSVGTDDEVDYIIYDTTANFQNSDIGYEITTSDSSFSGQGSFYLKWGNDYFGNVGSSFFYMKSKTSIVIPASVTHFIFSIVYDNNMASGEPGATTFDTLIKFGSDGAVNALPVTFVE